MNLSGLIDFLKDETLFREFLYFGLGIFLLTIINFLFNFDLKNIPNYSYFSTSSFLLFIIISSSAYFLSRICYGIGVAVNDFIIFVFSSNKKETLKKEFSKIKKFVDEDNWRLDGEEIDIHSPNEVLDTFVGNKYLLKSYRGTELSFICSAVFSGFLFFTVLICFFIKTSLPTGVIFGFFLTAIFATFWLSYQLQESVKRIVAVFERKKREN